MARDESAEPLNGPAEVSGRRPRTPTTIAVLLAGLAVIAAVIWSTFQGPAGQPGPGSTTAGGTTSTGVTTSTAPPTSSVTSAPSTPGVAPTGDADATAPKVTVDPRGAVSAADVPYLLDRTLHTGSRTVSYTFDPPFAYVPLAEGKAVIVENNIGTSTGDRAQLADATGRTVATVQARPEHTLLAMANDAGTQYALLDVPVDMKGTNGVLTLYDGTGAKRLTRTGVPEDLRPAGFVGDRLFLGNWETAGTFVWDLGSNRVSRYAVGVVAVSTSESSGRVAFARLADYEKPRCATVSDVRGSKPVPVSTTCGQFSATELSKDGRYLLGIRVPSDGSLQSPSRVIDVTTGRPLVYLESQPMNIESHFMADGSVGLNVYVSTGGAPRNTIMRCTLDGQCSPMVQTLPMPDYDQTLATRYTLVRQ